MLSTGLIMLSRDSRLDKSGPKITLDESWVVGLTFGVEHPVRSGNVYEIENKTHSTKPNKTHSGTYQTPLYPTGGIGRKTLVECIRGEVPQQPPTGRRSL